MVFPTWRGPAKNLEILDEERLNLAFLGYFCTGPEYEVICPLSKSLASKLDTRPASPSFKLAEE